MCNLFTVNSILWMPASQIVVSLCMCPQWELWYRDSLLKLSPQRCSVWYPVELSQSCSHSIHGDGTLLSYPKFTDISMMFVDDNGQNIPWHTQSSAHSHNSQASVDYRTEMDTKWCLDSPQALEWRCLAIKGYQIFFTYLLSV